MRAAPRLKPIETAYGVRKIFVIAGGAVDPGLEELNLRASDRDVCVGPDSQSVLLAR